MAEDGAREGAQRAAPVRRAPAPTAAVSAAAAATTIEAAVPVQQRAAARERAPPGRARSLVYGRELPAARAQAAAAWSGSG